MDKRKKIELCMTGSGLLLVYLAIFILATTFN